MACPVSAAQALLLVVQQEVQHHDSSTPFGRAPSYVPPPVSVHKSLLFEPTKLKSLSQSACQPVQGLPASCDSGMSDRSNPCEVEVFTADGTGIAAHSAAASGRAVLENYSGYPAFHLQLPSDIAANEDGKQHSPSGECSAMSNRDTQGLHLNHADQAIFTSSARGEVASGPLPLFQGNGPLRTSVDAGSSSTQTPPATTTRSPSRNTATQPATGKRGADRESAQEGNMRKQARLTGAYHSRLRVKMRHEVPNLACLLCLRHRSCCRPAYQILLLL